MRLFPAPFEGLHPAFPTPEPPARGHPAVAYIYYVSIAALIPIVGPKLFFRKAAWSDSAVLASYDLIAATGYGCFQRRNQNQMARIFLKDQVIELPRIKFLDRVGVFDGDDASLAGATLGVLVASQLRRPWTVVGWKRWVSAAVMGAGASTPVVPFIAILKDGLEERTRSIARQQAVLQEAEKWLPQIRKALSESQLKGMANLGVPVPSSVPSLPATSSQPDKFEPDQVTATILKAITPQDKIGCDRVTWHNETNEPHLTSKPDWELEPLPYANTNYTWTSSSGHAIIELEAHISKLRHRRQKLASECEHLWHWLAVKEAEYYDFNGQSDSGEKVKKRRYIETLGNVHTKVWVEVNKCDWMIADVQKRTEQLRSSNTSKNGRMTWLPPLSATESRTEPRTAQGMLEGYYYLVQERKASIESTRAEMVSMINKSGLDVDETMSELMRSIDSELENVLVDEEAVGRVVRDGEERITKVRSKNE